MATQPPVIPANYGAFEIDQKTYIRVGPIIHEVVVQRDATNNFMGKFLIQASKSTDWEQISPFLATIIITTTAAQPKAPQPPPPPLLARKKVLAEKPGQFKAN